MRPDAEPLVHAALRRHARGAVGALSPGTRLAEVVDSLRLILVVLELHRLVGGRPFDARAAAKLVTVGDLVAAVRDGGDP